ncbi:6660_t:CDS:2 [Diversispora eburnea]|uniref:6660_t:CDS:1 n=1 Tax=Diversispora eburnea TaxID=1213867 RepID=A0A9N8Z0H6_9GLOM|nr:6660_t:CDS:2 [Diversispora eburnea]
MIYRKEYNNVVAKLNLSSKDVSKFAKTSWENEPKDVKDYYRQMARNLMEGYSSALRKETENEGFSTRPLNNVSHGTSRMLPDSAFRVFLKNNRRNHSSAENVPEQSSAMRSEVFGTCSRRGKFNTNYALCRSCDPRKLKEGEVKMVNGIPEKSRSNPIIVALKTIPEGVNEDFLNEVT